MYPFKPFIAKFYFCLKKQNKKQNHQLWDDKSSPGTPFLVNLCPLNPIQSQHGTKARETHVLCFVFSNSLSTRDCSRAELIWPWFPTILHENAEGLHNIENKCRQAPSTIVADMPSHKTYCYKDAPYSTLAVLASASKTASLCTGYFFTLLR